MDSPPVPVYVAPIECTADRVEACETAVRALLGESGTRLVVDLSSVVFLASSALGMLVKLSMRLHDRGGGLALAGTTPAISRMVKMVGLVSVLPSFPTVDAATRHLAGATPARV